MPNVNVETTKLPPRAWAEINLSALRHNLKVARRRAGAAGEVMAVVKANAYGHGAPAIAAELERNEVDAFGVACLSEAMELRAAGATRPIYLLSPPLPEERLAVVEGGFIPAVSTAGEIQAYAALARARRIQQPVSLAVDTGMGRIGAREEEVAQLAQAISRNGDLKLDSLASHFPSADEDEVFTREQLRRYLTLLKAITKAGQPWLRHHVANSAGALRLPRHGHEMIRVGLMLYGVSPLAEYQSLLRPVLTFKAYVTLVRTVPPGWGISYGRTFVSSKPINVAVLAVGYADGYPRHLSGAGASVYLNGKLCPLLGRVTMDQVVVKAPAWTRVGDVAVLLGAPGPSASELAAMAGTIPYEIFTGLGPRVRRVVIA